jgi:hypothetical protein
MPFDRSIARLMLEVCDYTYASAFQDAASRAAASGVLAWLLQHGGVVGRPSTLIGDQKVATSVACVAECPDKLILAYMGTKTAFRSRAFKDVWESTRDWSKNANAAPVGFRLRGAELGNPAHGERDFGCKVHGGFLSELRAVQPMVIQELRRRGDKPVYVTGHSQGGAEAALAVPALRAAGFNVVEACTFAAPRPGDDALHQHVRELGVPVHRIEFGNDVVPHLPPFLADDAIDAALLNLLSNRVGRILVSVGRRFMPDELEDRLERWIWDDRGFMGVGSLCYAAPNATVRMNLAEADERTLFAQRLKALKQALRSQPDELAEHHHLRGTADDERARQSGNYLGMVG